MDLAGKLDVRSDVPEHTSVVSEELHKRLRRRAVSAENHDVQ